MSKNLVIGTKTYEGVSTVNFNTADDSIAVFKDVDEMTSGSFDIPTEMTLVGTNNTGADMLLKDFFAANEAVIGLDEIAIFKVEGDTAPTTGSYTLKTLLVVVSSGNNGDVAQAVIGQGRSQKVAPSTIAGFEQAVGGFNSAYFTRNLTTGALTVNQNYNTNYIPAGASVYYARYPISWITGLMHE